MRIKSRQYQTTILNYAKAKLSLSKLLNQLKLIIEEIFFFILNI